LIGKRWVTAYHLGCSLVIEEHTIPILLAPKFVDDAGLIHNNDYIVRSSSSGRFASARLFDGGTLKEEEQVSSFF
jgi:hypothetical protein